MCTLVVVGPLGCVLRWFYCTGRAEEMNPHTYTVNPFDEMLRDVLVLFQK